MRNLLKFAGFSVTLAMITSPVHAQILGGGLLPPIRDITRDVETGLEDRLERDLLRDVDMTSLLDRADSTEALGRIRGGVSETLDVLPEILPILDLGGTLALTEVEVENGWRAVEREWLLTVSADDMAMLAAMDIEILERTSLAAAGLEVIRVRVPEDRDSYRVLEGLLPAETAFDRNHLYDAQQGAPGGEAPALPSRKPVLSGPAKIGMIDTSIMRDHEGFAGRNIVTRDFVEEGLAAPVAHGTAIAGLFVGHGEAMEGFAPQATLYAASAFYQRTAYDQGATTISLVKAVDWLMQEDVAVINMSLAGPPNAILEQVLKSAQKQGIIIVAAAGNAGPAAPPLYPAAYGDVVAVTAVDQHREIYRWANRGDYVDFSALGVSVPTVRASGGFGLETGTSIATAYVTSLLVRERVQEGRSPDKAISMLAQRAFDLGDAGRDPVFGYGLLEDDQKLSFSPAETTFSE